MSSRVGGRPLVGRRDALAGSLALAAAGAACARPDSVAGRAETELYVSLGRSASVGVLNTISNRMVARLPLAPLGWDGPAGQLAVGPSGSVGLLQLRGPGGSVGVISRPGRARETGPAAGAGRAPADSIWSASRRALFGTPAPDPRPVLVQGEERMAAVDIPFATGDPSAGALPNPAARSSRARLIASDAVGRAYVYVDNPFTVCVGTIAVVDLDGGALTHSFPIADAGEFVLALAVHPGGHRLYASVWQSDVPEDFMLRWERGRGFIVTVDTLDGRVLARTALPDLSVATSLTHVRSALPARHAPSPRAAASEIAPPAEQLYALITSPPIQVRDEGTQTEYHSLLATFDAADLEPADVWPVDYAPTTAAIRPDGRRAYFLSGRGPDTRRQLISYDLESRTPAARWPLSDLAFEMAATPGGTLYVADLAAARLFRLDMRSDTALAPLDLGDVPIALAARPV